ncbi:hypothetical protein, partial [Solemya pervernicosa gill symbiont]|uniref:hypothetical protein n=1 Tax=Solemya pervernicosa gill symbiont TaxID=642797 RepID=UPI001F1928E0
MEIDQLFERRAQPLARGGYHRSQTCKEWKPGESLFLRKLVLGIQAQASGKYLTRPFMPTAPR